MMDIEKLCERLLAKMETDKEEMKADRKTEKEELKAAMRSMRSELDEASNRELKGSKQGRKPCEGTLGPATWKWCPHLNPR
jgi:hypothetical protein